VLEFTIPGVAKPQGSKRGFITKSGRVALVEQAGRPLKQWRDTVTLIATRARINEHWDAFAEGPMGVSLVFGMRRPTKPKFDTPAVRPDIDKLVRAVLDGLTDAHLWKDDGQVVSLRAEKVYGGEGVSVRVWKIL
jgi:Holliday junction resolvase RusA-like endonuclease